MNRGVTTYISIGEWLFKIILLNIYWFVFSLAGLFLFGLFPATAALFATIRQELKSETDVKLFQTYWHSYKQEFLKANLLGYLIGGSAGLLLINLQILGQLEGSFIHSLFMIMTYILLAVIALISVYILPIYVHYQFSLIGYIKYSAVMVLGKPLQTILLLLLIAATCYFYYSFPGFIPVIGTSLLAYIIMRTAYRSFAD
ncbi:YesL family protein [Gracilibacillus alcaliphilus]|uniref:YesL family protein n=1 Tax=Gracilibacillus alcaliphilus TaxID=1401441 RepID=UPI00195CA5A3|nr:DUF624 domain-containing protein [Gracilibacillus alcaliphilus]MBM7679139.1 putative membrane protein YesL [Gracilibacillus alcaliphilus]